MVRLIAKILIAILLGFLAGHSVVYILTHIPASWLCDYDEDPAIIGDQ